MEVALGDMDTKLFYPQRKNCATADSETVSISPKNALHKSMKLLFWFTKLCGFLPIGGIFSFSENIEYLTFKKRTVSRLLSLLIIVTLSIKTAISTYSVCVTKLTSILDIVEALSDLSIDWAGLFVVIFLYRNCEMLIQCLWQWQEIEYGFDKNLLPISVNLGVALVLFSAIGESLTFDSGVLFFTPSSDEPMSILQKYLIMHEPMLQNALPYNDIISIIWFILFKLSVYAYNIGDIFISVFAILTYKRFDCFNSEVRKTLNVSDMQAWQKFVEYHAKLLDMLHFFCEFLSPLVFVCVFVNVYKVGQLIFIFMRPAKFENIVKSEFLLWLKVWKTWAILHWFIRAFGTFYFCSRVNERVHEFESILRKCPIACLTEEVKRADLILRTNVFGFRGLNFFTITKPFILDVLHVIFTIEIVLLQASQVDGAT